MVSDLRLRVLDACMSQLAARRKFCAAKPGVDQSLTTMKVLTITLGQNRAKVSLRTDLDMGLGMLTQRIEPQFIEDERGAFTTSYGPYVLKTAFQPIFSQDRDGYLTIEAYEALIRPFRGNQPASPGELFSSVDPKDALFVDTLCRELHILNMGKMAHRSAWLFVNFNPGLFIQGVKVADEVSRMLETCGRAKVRPSRIVCEITEQGGDEATLMSLVEHLRASRFKIAVDDYGADDSDLQRVDRVKPDVIKFDAAWVRRFSETPAGIGLLRLMVEKFLKRNMDCLFEGLEEEHQLNLCQEIGVNLMQGYVLARPEIAPTDFDTRFPERQSASTPFAGSQPKAIEQNSSLARSNDRFPLPTQADVQPAHALRRNAPFGRRHR